MKQIDWTRLSPRPKGSTDGERIKYLVMWLMKARGSEKTKQRAIKELAELKNYAIRTSNT